MLRVCFQLFMGSLVVGLIVAGGAIAAIAAADKIVLTNGDRITGKVIDAQDGQLRVRTSYSGTITIRTRYIQSIATEEVAQFRFDDRSAVSGRLVTRDETIFLQPASPTDEREEIPVLWDNLDSINIPELTWSGNLHLGGTHVTGNTKRQGVNIGGQAVRRSLDNRLSLKFSYNYAEEDDSVSSRNVFGAAKFDHFFHSDFYALLSVELLNDKFKDLRLRTVIGPGGGIQLWDNPKHSLAVEGGVAYFIEQRIENPDERWITGRIAAVYSRQLTSRIRFTDSLIFYPHLKEWGEYTLRNDAALITDIANDWALRLGSLWERDSDPAPGVKKDDLRTSISLQYAF